MAIPALARKAIQPNSLPEMACWTRAIVRLDEGNRMVTEGYRKGVYECYQGNQRRELMDVSGRFEKRLGFRRLN
jgi:hypothetical protein